jgi:hypothetical protein
MKKKKTPSNEKETRQGVEVPVIGSTEAFFCWPENYDLVTQWTWYAVPSQSRTHAVTVINDYSLVDLPQLNTWVGLMKGATPQNGWNFDRRPIPATELRKTLEAQLETASMEEVVRRLYADAK